MTYTENDIKHLDLMNSIDELKAIESDEVSIQPKFSFDENILKLCTGLREKGFNTQAETLENKFITYKAAANTHLYRAHDEDGEDLINAAHPDGDPNMGDGEHGDVETIVSKHKKIVDIVNKTPTGKLSFYVNQCKIALGQDKAQLLSKIKADMLVVKKKIYEIFNLAGINKTSIFSDNLSRLKSEFDDLTQNITADTLENLKDKFMPQLKWVLKPGKFLGISKDNWPVVEAKLTNCDNLIEDALTARNALLDLGRKEEEKSVDPSDQHNNIDHYIAESYKIKTLVKSNDPKEASMINEIQSGLDQRIKILESLKTNFNQDLFNKCIAGLDELEKEWNV